MTDTLTRAAQPSAPASADLERDAGAARTAEEIAGKASDAVNLASDAADRAFALIQALPIEAHLVMVAALASGFVLWLWGKKLVKPSVGLLGACLGAFVGLFLSPAFGIETLFEIPIWIIGLVAGAVAGLALFLLLLKTALIGLSSAAVGLAGLLGSIAYVHANAPPPHAPGHAERQLGELPGGVRSFDAQLVAPRGEDGLTPRERVRRDIEALGLRLQETTTDRTGGTGVITPDHRPELAEAAPSEIDEVLDHVETVATTGFKYVRAQFESIDQRDQFIVAGSTLAGLGLGAFFGFLMPKRSTAFVTALAGSALMLASAAWLAEVAPERVSVVRRAFEHSPERWAIIWPAVAVLGLALQLTRSARKKRRAADD